MNKKLNLLNSLIENDSIQLNVEAKDWENALRISFKPLLLSNAIQSQYIESVITSTNKYGPYYIICDQVAMPHSKSEDGVNKDSFALTILKKPVFFKGDDRNIRVLISLAATSADIHVSNALPQVVATFENEQNIKKIINAKNKKEIISILKKVDFSKYLK